MAMDVRARWYDVDFFSAETSAPVRLKERMARMKITKLMRIMARIGPNWAAWKGTPKSTQLQINGKKINAQFTA